jgi:acetoacetyl-CoA synthetase
MAPNPIIWQPDAARVSQSAMRHFMQAAGCDSYDQLHAWSIDDSPAFWESLCGFCGVEFDQPPATVLARPDNIMDAGWFEGSRLNFAKHLLRCGGDKAAVVYFGEDGKRRELSRDDLREQVAAIAAGLRAVGVTKGDRVGGFLPNCPEAIIAMLATASLGAIWSSCSPDFGINGVVDRFGQIRPKVLFAVNGYYYNGKTCDTRPIVEGVVAAVDSIATTVMVPFAADLATDTSVAGGSYSRRWTSIIRSTLCIHRAPRVFPSASFTVTAVPCCSTSRNTCCIRIFESATGFSTSRPVAG